MAQYNNNDIPAPRQHSPDKDQNQRNSTHSSNSNSAGSASNPPSSPGHDNTGNPTGNSGSPSGAGGSGGSGKSSGAADISTPASKESQCSGCKEIINHGQRHYDFMTMSPTQWHKQVIKYLPPETLKICAPCLKTVAPVIDLLSKNIGFSSTINKPTANLVSPLSIIIGDCIPASPAPAHCSFDPLHQLTTYSENEKKQCPDAPPGEISQPTPPYGYFTISLKNTDGTLDSRHICSPCLETLATVMDSPDTFKPSLRHYYSFSNKMAETLERSQLPLTEQALASSACALPETFGHTAIGRVRELEGTVKELEKQIKDLKLEQILNNGTLADQEVQIRGLESAAYNGILVWKITEFARRRSEATSGKTTSFYSPPFYTSYHGYKMCARIYLNGDGMGKATHLSLFFVVMKGRYDNTLRWPFPQKVTLMLVDQSNNDHVVDAFRPDPFSSSFRKPVNEMNIASGCPLFVELSLLDNPDYAYVRDDCLFVKMIVDVRNLEST